MEIVENGRNEKRCAEAGPRDGWCMWAIWEMLEEVQTVFLEERCIRKDTFTDLCTDDGK